MIDRPVFWNLVTIKTLPTKPVSPRIMEVDINFNASSTPSVLSSTTMEPYTRPFSSTAIWVSAIFLFSMLVIGMALNILTMCVILKYKKLRNLFVYFIFSLCVSDLVSALISPLFWYRRTVGFDHWAAPGFFCKLYWAADLMTSFATALHIVSFGTFRLISIRYPHFFTTISNKIGVVLVIIIWIVSFTCGFIPYFVWFGARKRDRYSDSPDARWPACTINMEWYGQYTLFQKIAFPLFLYVPLVLVVIISVITCAQVFATIRSTVVTSKTNRQRLKERQAVLQLSLIVLSFLFGYIPFTAYEFWSVQDHEHTDYIRSFDYYFGLIEYILLRLSECMNPIFYNLGSSKMRMYTRRFVRDLLDKLTGTNGIRTRVPSESRTESIRT